MSRIPFNKPYLAGCEISYIVEAHRLGHLSGDGRFTRKAQDWLESRLVVQRALLTHSCTAALEMSAMLLDLQPGDEVILPSFTFPSTANAFVLRGAVPVFVDIRADTLNIDEDLIPSAITSRTKAICVVHYAGVPCAMDKISQIAREHNLAVVEDAAQAVLSTYRGQQAGAIGDLGALSFHETKNLVSGEGGALLVNNAKFLQRAEIIREKGTDRSRFFRGEVDKYRWIDFGSSFLPSELVAAFLFAQLEHADRITAMRRNVWAAYHQGLAELEALGKLRRPIIPSDVEHNGHLYYVLLSDEPSRDHLIRGLNARGIHAVSHYVPLHSAPAGLKFGRPVGEMPITNEASTTIVRLPLWVPDLDTDSVVAAVHEVLLPQFGLRPSAAGTPS